jgi:hypothetical protein
MKYFMNSLVVNVVLIILLQGCGNDTKPNCNCDSTDHVLDFNSKEGKIYFGDDGVSWRAWVITARSQDNSQIFSGIICNLDAAPVRAMLDSISTTPNNSIPVIFSGRATQLCPKETRPVSPSNNSFFYIKVTDIKLK